jgi:Family of unknown function (DUF6221)
MTEISDLIAFVTARLDEDEATAKAAGEPGGQFSRPGAGFAPDWKDEGGAVSSSAGEVVFDEGNPTEAQSAHIARHDPARALREVEAGRKLLTRYAEAREFFERPVNAGYPAGEVTGLRMAIRCRAAIWDGHPDYRPEWKP